MRALPACVLALTLVATPSLADTMVRYTWGPADGLIVNQDFTGPQTYTQTFSITGLSGALSAYIVRIRIVIAYPYWVNGPGSAWHAIQPRPLFTAASAPQPDCEGGPGFAVHSMVAGATSIPNAVPTASFSCGSGVTGGGTKCGMQLDVVIPPFVGDPATRYGIATLEYHHQNSAAGVSPDACDHADLPMCWVQTSADLVLRLPGNNFNTTISLPIEGGLLSWENDPMVVNCYSAATPTRRSTWGSIKTLYR